MSSELGDSECIIERLAMTNNLHQGRSPNVHHGPWSTSSSHLSLLPYLSSTPSLKNGGAPLHHLQEVRLRSVRLLSVLQAMVCFTDPGRIPRLTTSTAILAVLGRKIILMSQGTFPGPTASTQQSHQLLGLNLVRT